MRISCFRLSSCLKAWVMAMPVPEEPAHVLYDSTLLWLPLGLVGIGFVMVTLALMSLGAGLSDDPFHYAKRDSFYLVLAFVLSLETLRIPMAVWQRYSSVMLLITLMMLLVVLVVGN